MAKASTVITCVLLLGSISAHAGLISAPIRDLDIAATHGFGGPGPCVTTSGSYDAASLVWQQYFQPCDSSFSLIPLTGSSVDVESMTMTATGLVDNSGYVLGGTFAWSGAIPDLGIDEVSLLGSGSVLDVWYGRLPNYSPTTSAVIKLDFLAGPLEDYGFGEIFEWVSYVTINEWEFPSLVVGSNCTTEELCPWESSMEFDWGDAYTEYEFLSYDRAVLVPEPDTLGLFVLGLATLGFMRRRSLASELPCSKE